MMTEGTRHSNRALPLKALHALRARLAAVDRGMLVIVALFLLLLPISNPRVALSDEVQYYAYLRSVYFDGDLDFQNEYEHFAQVGLSNGDPAIRDALLRRDAVNPNPVTGLLRNVAPVGSAMLWSPGFVLADIGVRLANGLGAKIAADGYSWPYIWGACYMSALYALLGLLLSYRLTRRFTATFPATLATVAIWLATPLIFYSYAAMPWSHATALFLFALLLTLWMRGWQGPLEQRLARRPLVTWALLGFVGGLMTITREQLGLLLIIPAAEGVYAYVRLLRERRRPEARALFVKHVVFVTTFGLALLPQLTAYQILNGRPGPSSTVAGKLSPISWHFFGTLFDARHGAFLWSPILLIGLIGLAWLVRRDRMLAALLLLGFIAQTYINGAFGTTWHLSGSFGFRRLIECTPIFVVGLALVLERLRLRVGRWPLVLAVVVLIYWNFALIAQWGFVRKEIKQGLVWDGMLYHQVVEVPRQVLDKFDALLFDRCALITNCPGGSSSSGG